MNHKKQSARKEKTKSLEDAAQIHAAQLKVTAKGVEPEREHFRALMLSNPNYFGNIKESTFQAVKTFAGNTSYEEMVCVGFNPQFDRLEAVVLLKKDVGYGGNLCQPGNPEHVRFYADWNNTGDWTDLGATSFTAHDMPGEKPLEYVVTLEIDPQKRFCFVENLPGIRAILSYNIQPPPDTPDYLPVWGNAIDARIQIGGRKFFIVGELVKDFQFALPKQLEKVVDLEASYAVKAAAPLTTHQLREIYKDTDVPAHRYLSPMIQELAAKPAVAPSATVPILEKLLPGFEVDYLKVFQDFLNTDGNTNYEELDCVGLNINTSTLAGVLTVKLSAGYSGGLCDAGSREYVAFWMDWGEGAGWEYAGTSSVTVHDIGGIPAEGLQYAVFLPVNLAGRRQPCEDGAKLVKVRAILSWQTPPPPTNPNYVPHWGNREETTVQITVGPNVPQGVHTPFLESVGNMAVSEIDPVTGLANGPAVAAGFTAVDSPFGGTIVVTGHIAYPPDVVGGGALPLKYKVYVSDDGGAVWQPLANSFRIWLTQLQDGVWSGPTPITQSVDVDGWYTYREDLTAGPGNAEQFVVQNVLAHWHTGAAMTGLWKIKIEAKDPVTNMVYPGVQIVTVRLDNKVPDAGITITSGGGPCADFTIGDVITGTYEAIDEHFGSLNLGVSPGLGGTFTAPPSLPRVYPTDVPSGTGETGTTWSLDTAGMPKCGYVVRIHVKDRTIVNSGSIGHHGSAVVGLCLREPGG